jgi:hypothetical protein
MVVKGTQVRELLTTSSVRPAPFVTRRKTSRLAPNVFTGVTKFCTVTDKVPGPATVTAKTSKSVLRSMMPVAVAVPVPLSVRARAVAMVLPWSSVR